MYTNKTPNLELPQWQLDDYLQPIADLNPAFAKLDTSITESNTKLSEALQKVQELTQQVTEDMAAIEQAKKDIQKNATDITDINQVLDGVKLKEAEVDAALKQIGLNVTKLFNNDLNIVRDLTALVDAETTRAKAQEEIIDTKATSAAVAAADAQNLAETSKSFAEEAKNSAAEAAQSASDSATQATQAQETATAVQENFNTNVKPQVQEAKDAALAAQQSAEAANRQATLSAGYASNAARDAATATETATSADEKATEALEKATQAQTDAAQAKTDAQTASEQTTQAATSASTAETKATEAAASASTAEENATAAAADAESAKQDAASAKAEADAAKLSADAAAQSAASAEESAGTAATTSADAMLKAETVETGFNQLKDTEWPAYKEGIDQSIEQLRGEIPTAESLAEDFVGKTGAQEMEGPLTINAIDSDGGLIVKCDGQFGGISITDSTDTSNATTALSIAELQLSAPIDSDNFYRIFLNSQYVSGTGILNVTTNTKNNTTTTPTIIRGVADPIQLSDAATKKYVDSLVTPLHIVTAASIGTVYNNSITILLSESVNEVYGGVGTIFTDTIPIYFSLDSNNNGFMAFFEGTFNKSGTSITKIDNSIITLSVTTIAQTVLSTAVKEASLIFFVK